MGYLTLFDLTGPVLHHDRVVYQVLKDIALMVLGVLAATQEDELLKYVFFAIAWSIAFWLIYDVSVWKKQCREAFPEHLGTYMSYAFWWFMATWTIFPLLYCLGPSIFNVISGPGDQIGHAIGDLLAKNMFGFLVWWTRFKIIKPYMEEHPDMFPIATGAEKLISSKVVDSSGQPLKSGTSAPQTDAFPICSILVVEPNFAYQRLIMYIAKDCNIEATMVQSISDAIGVFKRDKLDRYDMVLTNISNLDEVRDELAGFRQSFGVAPYFFPVLGYSLEEDPDLSIQKCLQAEEEQPTCTDAILHFMLDARYVGEMCSVWKENSINWREQHIQEHERSIQQQQQQYYEASLNGAFSPGSPVQGYGVRPPSISLSRNNSAASLTNSIGSNGGPRNITQQNNFAMSRPQMQRSNSYIMRP